jgi:dihydropteroate synthase
MAVEHIHFVTGRLAEFSLRRLLNDLGPAVGFQYSIEVLGITVAALMTPQWIARRIHVPPEATRVLIPGYCYGELGPIEQAAGVPVACGPKDLRDLPAFFGREPVSKESYGQFDIEILAEINHAPRLTRDAIMAQAAAYKASGADLIDVGCDPGATWPGVYDVVRELRDQGYRVSIDSLNPDEIAAAVRGGAELVLSVNSTNRQRAVDWGCEVVVVPDVPETLAGLDETVEFLATAGVRLRIDPVLEPIGFGFANSLGRYLSVRERYPDAEMLMGIGNLTELTDADSAAINVLLLGFCQETGIRSVLTTEVIPWARTSVRECDLARRLMYYAVKSHALPKRVEPRLVMLRDSRLNEYGPEALERLAQEIRDQNYRLFAERGKLHVIAGGLHLEGTDPFELFEQIQTHRTKSLDPAHAFYLGYEMAKAATALTLGKQYRQDESLDWGFLTVPEQSQRERHARRNSPPADAIDPQPETP